MQNLTDLLNARTAEQVFNDLTVNILAKTNVLGDAIFSVTDWNTGGVARTLLEVDASTLADAYTLVPVITEGGFLDYALGAWLDLLALSSYQVTRKPSEFAIHTVVLSAASGFGPYTLQAGDIWAISAGGKRYNSTTGGTIPVGGTLTLSVLAEYAGQAYNVPANSITTLLTPLPGVTITNPINSLIRAGVDTETDTALRLRCRLRWATLGGGATVDAYRFWALTSRPEVTRVRVRDDHPRGQGTIDIVVWGAGGLGGGVLAAVDAYIQQRRPITANVLTYNATEVVQTVTATIYVQAALRASAEITANANLAALQQNLEIGGLLANDAIIASLRVAGVTDVDLTTPATDIQLGIVEVATFSSLLTWIEV